MIISHKYKFIFIKTAKVAGTSVEMYISQYLGNKDVFPPFTSPEAGQEPLNFKGLFNPVREIAERWKISRNWKENGFMNTFRNLGDGCRFFEPMPAWQVRARVPRGVWDGYYKFTIERNPYEKAVSRFFHSKAVYEPKYKKELTMDGWLDYVEYHLKHPWLNMAYGAVAPYNFPRYAHPSDDRVLVDKICRYEKLIEELSEVFQRLGIPFEGELHYRAKGKYRSDRRHYSEILNENQRSRIDGIFKKEFDLMGYKWEA